MPGLEAAVIQTSHLAVGRFRSTYTPLGPYGQEDLRRRRAFAAYPQRETWR